MQENSKKIRIQLSFILAVAIILICAVAIIVIVGSTIIESNIVSEEQVVEPGIWWIILLAVSSVIIGMVLAYIFSKIFFKPIDNLVANMHKLAEGDYSVRIVPGKYKSIRNIAETFNTLASELQNTEILRSDFVNNFSHEIKTPIASVNGLISLLNNENLPKAKQKQYLNIIEKEIDRLSSMTTNILNLSKIEMQDILTDKVSFNISEQIRGCVLLLERGWTEKNLSLSLDFNEYTVLGNEDMLRQVWVNLIDNAVKFATEGSELKISIDKTEEGVIVKVENEGQPIPDGDNEKIFNKFYQAEGKKDGNGIGLSIVKKIIHLHEGTVYANSSNGKTVFTVILP